MDFKIKKVYFIFIIFLLSCILISASQSQSPGDYYSFLDNTRLLEEEQKILLMEDGFDKFARLGIIYHFMCSQGEKKARAAIDYFNRALELEPDNYIVRAYLGSVYTLLANEEPKPAKKMKHVKKGLAMLDEIYKQYPDDFEINVLIIYHSVEISDEMFERTYLAEEAVARLEKNFKKHKKEEQAGILYLKSITLLATAKELEGIDLLKIIIKKYPKTRYAGIAKKKLEIYSE